MSTTRGTNQPIPLSLSNLFEHLRGGMVQAEAQLELQKCIERIQETGKKAKLTITLDLMPAGPGNSECHVSAGVKATMPAKLGVSDSSIFYAERGKLYQEDPSVARETANALAKAGLGRDDRFA